jgi:hypothetical protein
MSFTIGLILKALLSLLISNKSCFVMSLSRFAIILLLSLNKY